MNPATLATLFTSIASVVAALTAAWHAWQTRKTVVQGQAQTTAQSPAVRPSSGGSQP